MIIYSDIDGVLADAAGGVIDYLYRKYNLVLPRSAITSYDIAKATTDFFNSSGYTPAKYLLPSKIQLREELRTLFQATPGFFNSLRLYHEAWAQLYWLKKKGHEIHFVTSRRQDEGSQQPDFLRAETNWWLCKHGFTSCSRDFPSPLTKAKWLSQAKKTSTNTNTNTNTIFLEDSLQEAQEIATDHPDVSVWLIDRPWNRKKPEPEYPKNLHRVNEEELSQI